VNVRREMESDIGGLAIGFVLAGRVQRADTFQRVCRDQLLGGLEFAAKALRRDHSREPQANTSQVYVSNLEMRSILEAGNRGKCFAYGGLRRAERAELLGIDRHVKVHAPSSRHPPWRAAGESSNSSVKSLEHAIVPSNLRAKVWCKYRGSTIAAKGFDAPRGLFRADRVESRN